MHAAFVAEERGVFFDKFIKKDRVRVIDTCVMVW